MQIEITGSLMNQSHLMIAAQMARLVKPAKRAYLVPTLEQYLEALVVGPLPQRLSSNDFPFAR